MSRRRQNDLAFLDVARSNCQGETNSLDGKYEADLAAFLRSVNALAGCLTLQC